MAFDGVGSLAGHASCCFIGRAARHLIYGPRRQHNYICGGEDSRSAAKSMFSMFCATSSVRSFVAEMF